MLSEKQLQELDSDGYVILDDCVSLDEQEMNALAMELRDRLPFSYGVAVCIDGRWQCAIIGSEYIFMDPGTIIVWDKVLPTAFPEADLCMVYE
jgi:hypothetical protein